MKGQFPVACRYELPIERLEDRTLMSSMPFSAVMLEAAAHTGAVMAQAQAAPKTAPKVGASHAVSGTVSFDMASLLKTVKPLKHPLNGSPPMILWGWPGPTGDVLQDQKDGTLKTFIDQYAARGIDLPLPVGTGYYIQYTIAYAQTLEQDNLPVYLVFPRYDMISGTAYQNVTVQGTYTDPTSGQTHTYPCLPMADSSVGAAWVQSQLAPLQQAGIHVDGVMFDDESGPDPWGTGEYESQKYSACASYYPAGALDSFQSFIQYTYQLRSTLESQIMADPIHQMFPRAVVTDFGSFQSSSSSPFVDIRGSKYPPRQLDNTDALAPNLYNQEITLQNASPPAKPSAAWADDVFFTRWLTSFSSAAQNRGDKQLAPFVSGNIPGFWNSANLQFTMSRQAYKEALRHLWLRGTDVMWLFAGGGANATAAMGTNLGAFEMVDDSRAVYDGLLPFRKFLSDGTPMNLNEPDPSGTQPVWSGLKLGNQALVRTYSPSGKAQRVTIEAFAGVTVTLPATRSGAGFLISSNGHVRRVSF